jgi:predicted nuclease with TOPRIM domain
MLIKTALKAPIALAFILSPVLLTGGQALADALSKSATIQEQGLRDAIVSQQRIDGLADEAREMLDEYREVVRQSESLRAYNNQLDRMIEEQNRQLDSLRRQTDEARSMQQHLFPLVNRMLKVLEELIDLDMPFLMRERRLRLEELKHLLDDPDVSLPEKYRRMMEAFQIEMEYGQSIEAYRDEIAQEGRQRAVDMLRIGRIALLYLTPDGSQAGYWDTRSKRWQSLPSEFNDTIDTGLRIANKQAPPALLSIPLYAPERSR